MKKKFTFLMAAIAMLACLAIPIGSWGQVASVAPEDGKSYVVAAYVNSKYYALPNGTVNGSTIAGAEISLNALGKVSTTDAAGKTWTLQEGIGANAGKYYIKYTSGSDTYYLYKNGTGGSNYNFAVNKTSKNYWSFTTNGTGYTVAAVDRGTNNVNIQYNSGTFRCYSSATPIRLLEIGDAQTVTSLAVTGTPTKTTYEAGESFDPTGLTVTATYSDESTQNVTASVVWTPDPLTQGLTSVTGTYSNQTVTVNGITVTAPADPDIVLNKDNTPFTSTSGSNTSTETKTLDGIEYQNYCGYNYSNYLSFNKSQSGGYLGNNTQLCGNIKKIVVNYYQGGSSYLTMYEGATALSETTTVAPSSTGTGNVTYTFSGNTGFFKLKLTTTGTFVNITSISIYLEDCANPSITVSTNSLEGFTYIAGQGPSAAQSFTVSGDYLTANLNMSLGDNSDFEISQSQGSGYTNNIALAPNGSGAVSSTTIYARLKADKTKGNYNGTITLTSTDASEKTISLSGTVTAQTYTLTDESGVNGSITFTPASPVEAGTEVTLTATPASDDYYFDGSWALFNDGLVDVTSSITFVSANVIEMPAYNLHVDATFSLKPTHDVTCSTDGHGTVTASPASTYEGQTVTLTITPNDGYSLSTITATYNDGSAQTITLSGSGNTRTFTMPNYDVTVAATFISSTFAGLFEPFTGDIVEGDYVIYGGTNGAMKNAITSSRFENQSVTFNESNISNPNIAAVWHISQISGTNYWAIYNAATDKYAGGTSSKNQGALYDNTDDNLARWTIEYDNGYTFTNFGRTQASSGTDNAYLRQNGSSGWGTYLVSTGNAPQLYKYKEPVAPTWTNFPTAENLITGQNYELTVSNYVSGYPTPTITLNTVVSSSLYEFENGLFMFSSNATGDYAFTFTATNSAGSANVTLTITVNTPASVNYYYSNNGVLGAAQSITQGQSATLAAGSNLNDDFVFVGWTTDASDVDNVLAAGSQQTINAETTFYAIYSNTVSVTETKVVVLDGSGLTSTATTGVSSYTNNGVTYTLSAGAKQQSSNGENRFSSKAILIGKSGAYIYNTQDAFGQGITKFEVYANSGASAAVSVGINFSTTIISEYNAGAANTWTKTLSTVDHVYDASSALPAGAKYFWYQVTNSNNSQIQFRITYTKTTNVTTKYTRVYPANTTATDDITITGPTVITSGSVLDMGSYTLTNTDPANLIIEDGGQLITNSSVKATVKKTITGHGAKATYDGWTFIASPVVVEGGVNPAAVSGMINATATKYDLYRFNDGVDKEWENYKNTEDHPNFTLVNGKGYLYANEDGTSLDFAGDVNPSTPDINVSLQYTEGQRFAGWNLVGNPFTADAYITNMSYYRMENDGKGNVVINPSSSFSGAIKPCEGVMVKANDGGENVTFTTTEPEGSANNGNINIALAQIQATRGEKSLQTLDNAIVSFNEGSELGKFYFGTQKANLYIPLDNEEYAIVSAEACGEMPVNFKTAQDGQYTITVNPENVEMGYLHLIDNIAGTDIDLLANPSYTFNAKGDDYESRFRLVFSANLVNADLNDDFAFFSNGMLVIANEGESILQVIDVNGRIIATESVNGTCSKAINAKAGVYVLRLINGTDVKTQKIVVR